MFSFKANPSAYGLPKGYVNLGPSNYRSVQLRRYLPQIDKDILGEEYKPELITQAARIEGFEPELKKEIAGAPPEYRLVNPATDIWFNHNYQRRLRSADLVQIEVIADNWDWVKAGSLIAFESEDGRLFATDGQKRTIAAIYRGITAFPTLVYRAEKGQELKRQADSFVGTNLDRRAVPPAELLTALIMRGDEGEVTFARILKKNKIKPMPVDVAATGDLKRLETLCVSILRTVHKKTGDEKFNTLCQILAAGQYKPIRRDHIWAIKAILDKTDSEALDIDRMGNAIRSIVDRHALLEAKALVQKSHKRTTVAAQLADIYLTRYKKKANALNAPI